jgi:LemA protein
MDILPIILIVVALIVVIYFWSTYNSLVRLNVRVSEAWSDITIQLKRRADLIPNLIETVKAYATHEREVFERVTAARAATVSPEVLDHPAQAAAAEGEFAGALKSLFAVAEAYPQLQANQNFLALQQELTDTENKVMSARRFYNGGVSELNTKLEQFPQNVIFKNGKIKAREFFEVEDPAAIQEPPQVKF